MKLPLRIEEFIGSMAGIYRIVDSNGRVIANVPLDKMVGSRRISNPDGLRIATIIVNALTEIEGNLFS